MALSSKRTVLLVQFGPEHRLGLTVARALGQWRGTTIHLLTNAPRSAARHSRHVKSFEVCLDSNSVDHRVEALARAIRRTEPDVILPVDQGATRTLAAAAPGLPSAVKAAPVPPLPSLDLADDKGRLAAMLAVLGLPMPRTLAVSANGEFEAAVRAFRYPVLLKQTRNAGGRGIESFSAPETLIARVRRSPPEAGALIAQEFVPGSDLGCNVLCHQGEVLAYSLQRGIARRPRPFQICPAVAFTRDDRALASVRKLMAALQWHGVANVDLRLEAGTGCARILEMNPRFWASLLASAAFGVNFPELACRHALSLPIPFRPVDEGAFIVREVSGLGHLVGQLDWEGSQPLKDVRSVLRFVAEDPVPTTVAAVSIATAALRSRLRRSTRPMVA